MKFDVLYNPKTRRYEMYKSSEIRKLKAKLAGIEIAGMEDGEDDEEEGEEDTE